MWHKGSGKSEDRIRKRKTERQEIDSMSKLSQNRGNFPSYRRFRFLLFPSLADLNRFKFKRFWVVLFNLSPFNSGPTESTLAHSVPGALQFHVTINYAHFWLPFQSAPCLLIYSTKGLKTLLTSPLSSPLSFRPIPPALPGPSHLRRFHHLALIFPCSIHGT
jgi:hypothetical protein